jgi:hypothetical protein
VSARYAHDFKDSSRKNITGAIAFAWALPLRICLFTAAGSTRPVQNRAGRRQRARRGMGNRGAHACVQTSMQSIRTWA